MPNVTRITSNGTFYTANTIDEISYNLVGTRKNLLRNSQDFNRGLWTAYCGNANLVTYNTPDIEAPDGTFTSTKVVRDSTNVCGSVTPAWGFLYTATNIFTYGKTHTVSVWARTNTGTLLFNLGGNDYFSVSRTATTTWQRFTHTFVAVPNPTQGDRGIQFFTGVPNSTIYFWGAQLEEGPVATDYVRTDNSGVPISNFVFRTTQTGNYYVKSYIDEMSYNKNVPAKNLAYPANLALWSKGWDFVPPVINVTNETAAPDGTYTAVKWEQARESGTITTPFNNPIYKAGVPYTFSVYVKPGSPSMSFYILIYGFAYAGRSSVNIGVQFLFTPTSTTIADGSSGTADSYGIVPVGNGWYRCWMTSTNRVANNNQGHQFIRYTTSNTFAYFWGYQIEEGTAPTDYVETTNTGRIATNFVKRDTANGVSMVTSQFDERNGVLDQVVDSSLVINLDAAKSESYPGSGTTWFDTTPNKNDVTIFNSGISNSPIVWDYISQSFLALGNNLGTTISGTANATVNTPSFSIEIWSRVRSFTAGDFNNNMISGRGNYLSHGHRMGYNPAGGSAAATTGTVGFYSIYNAGNIALTSSTISINTWYQTVITFNDTSKFASFYVNGVLVASQRDATYTIPQQPAWTQGPSAFTNGQGCQSINGNIGNFMYYNRPLSASEVSQNYSAIRGRYGI